MVILRSIFHSRKSKVIFLSVVASVLVITGVAVGLGVGLSRRSSGSRSNEQEESVCSAAHETYVINGSSVLGKYNSAAVAVDSLECSRIGRMMLEKNGNAIDAAIAAAICNGVFNAHSMGIGGGCIMTVYNKTTNKAFSLIGREKAPAAANSTMYVGRENMSTFGGLAIGVPGEIRAYEIAHKTFGGRIPWKELFEPTIAHCRRGFNLSASQAGAIAQSRRFILADPTLSELFVKNNETKELYGAGDIIKRTKLADTLQKIADQGPDVFYTGELADKIVQEVTARGGILTKQDLKDFHVSINEPIVIPISPGLIGYTTQAPSSGPVLAFILNILRNYKFDPNDLKDTEKAALFYHRLIEAFKFAYAKRSEIGDPEKIDIVELIQNLTSADYAKSIQAKISDDKTYDVEYYGGAWANRITPGTAHLSVVDADGNAVGLTSTVNLFFGSKVMGPETGIIYNNEMDDFSTPNTTNSFGVPASPANFIVPGKRPVSSMAPLVVVEDSTRRVQQVLGASGGTRITTSIAQVSLLNLWFNENIKDAIDSPRIHSQLLPDQVIAEEGFNGSVLRLLKDRGHKINCGTFGGSVIQGIEWRDEVNQYWANSDVRKGGAPDGIN